MDTTLKIKVLIVDDHTMVREVFKALLRALDDFEVVAETGDARTVLTLCADYQPDVVLMDLLMPDMDGVTATRLIRNQFPNIQVVILSGSLAEPLIEDAIKAGAISYILKTGSIEELAHALRSAYSGQPTLASEVVGVLLAAIHHPQTTYKVGYDLAPRERQVLALIVKGLPNREIADRLFISESTVKYHISSIFSKLGTRDRTKIVALALEHKLIEKD